MDKNILILLLATIIPSTALAQIGSGKRKTDVARGMEYKVEAQGSFSRNMTPLWLNANKYGLSSLKKNNGYVRAAVERPLRVDSGRRWGVGYGVDVAAPFNYREKFIVQQAYAER